MPKWLVWVFKKLLTSWEFHAHQFLEATENGAKTDKCQWERQEEEADGYAGLSWQEGQICQRNELSRTLSCNTEDIETVCGWAISGGNHIWFYSCQLYVGTHAHQNLGFEETLPGLMNPKFCCNLHTIWSEFGINIIIWWTQSALY